MNAGGQVVLLAELFPGSPGEGLLCAERHLPLPQGAA